MPGNTDGNYFLKVLSVLPSHFTECLLDSKLDPLNEIFFIESEKVTCNKIWYLPIIVLWKELCGKVYCYDATSTCSTS
jgi:hypothetical protein